MSEELLFDKSLQKIKLLYRLIGLNIESNGRNLKKSFIFLFNLLWHQTDVIATIFWVIGGILRGENFAQLIFVAPCTVYGILADIQAILLFFKESKVHTLMGNIRDLETEAKDSVEPERDNLIKPEARFLHGVVQVLIGLNSLMIVVFNIFPLIFVAVKYFTTGQLELILPFLDVYPFDSFDLRIWPFAYLHQLWSVCISIIEVCAIDYFFFICCTHIRIQFKLLQHEFQQIIVKTTAPAVDTRDHLSVKAKFQQLIKTHQKLIRTTNMLEEIYSKSNLSNFIASSLIICLTGFNVTIADDNTLVVTFVVFLFMSLLQIFFLCFFGDLLMSSSTEVADAVYNCRWYLSDLRMQKNILLVQTRAQTPCKLTAAGFAYVNLRAYMKIMSTSWSYFALLQTIYGSRS